MQRSEMHISTSLKDFIIENVDPHTLHTKAIHSSGIFLNLVCLTVYLNCSSAVHIKLCMFFLKAVSIAGDEVFRFTMSLTPKATEGSGYGDMTKMDGCVKLSVGCIQLVYLHKFFMSLLVDISLSFLIFVCLKLETSSGLALCTFQISFFSMVPMVLVIEFLESHEIL